MIWHDMIRYGMIWVTPFLSSTAIFSVVAAICSELDIPPSSEKSPRGDSPENDSGKELRPGWMLCSFVVDNRKKKLQKPKIFYTEKAAWLFGAVLVSWVLRKQLGRTQEPTQTVLKPDPSEHCAKPLWPLCRRASESALIDSILAMTPTPSLMSKRLVRTPAHP